MTYAAAASFLTPIGYQTNLMVYGPGGYNFKDFLKIGLPLTLIYMVVSVLIVYAIFLW
jgi:di/tricarboxylate transporter